MSETGDAGAFLLDGGTAAGLRGFLRRCDKSSENALVYVCGFIIETSVRYKGRLDKTKAGVGCGSRMINAAPVFCGQVTHTI